MNRTSETQDLVRIFTDIIQGMAMKNTGQTVRPHVTLSFLNNVVTAFDPATTKIDEWLLKVDKWAIWLNWSDPEICCFALPKLVGAAKIFYEGLPSVNRSWTEWKQLLKQAFLPVRDIHSLLGKLLQFTSNNAPSYYEYTFQKLSMINSLKLNFDDRNVIILIMGGIDDNNIKFAVQTANIVNPGQLATYLKLFDTANSSTMRNNNNPNTAPLPCPINAKSSETTSNYTNYKNTLLCYYCKKPGHKRSACFAFRRNKNNNHSDEQSQDHRRSGAPANKTLALEYPPKDGPNQVHFIKFSQQNHFIKTILINNVKITCYIDLGSEISLNSSEFATALNLPQKSIDPVKLQHLGDHITETKLRTTALIQLDGINKCLNFFVVDKCLDYADVIIGRDFSEDHDVHYEKGPNGISFFSTHVNTVGVIYTESFEDNCETDITNLILEFNDCFSSNKLGDIGNCKISMKIDLTSDKPVCRGPYRLALKEHEVVGKIIHELLKANIIRPSTSCYSSPAILVKKPNRDYRSCVDYRHLNKITIPQIFPLPLIEDLIDRLAGFTYYSKVHLASGYHQFQIDKESIYKTVFCTPDGLYEFFRVPFGLRNAVAFFHKTLSDIFAPLRSQNKIILYRVGHRIRAREKPQLLIK
jgi:hypothetical protein